MTEFQSVAPPPPTGEQLPIDPETLWQQNRAESAGSLPQTSSTDSLVADPRPEGDIAAATFRSGRRRRSRVMAAAAMLGLVSCGSTASDPMAVTADPFTAPDSVRTGPQGTVGQFAVDCEFDRFLADDPIVHPDRAGASHLHQFFGAVGVHASSTYDELLAGETTCEQRADTASYWAPALLDADLNPIEPMMATAYYRAADGVDINQVVAYPPGFMAVAGDHTAIEPQPLSVVAWSCDTGSLRSVTPPDCTDGTSLRLMITFEDCWDGEHVRSPIVSEPARHVAYSDDGECPASHPVHIPQLQLAVAFPAVDPEGLALASGNILSGHADFWNGWQQDKLEREVSACVVRNLPCKITGSPRSMGET